MKTYPKYKHLRFSAAFLAAIGFVSLGLLPAAADQIEDVQTFMPAGPIGPLLTPGTFYPPAEGDQGILKRKQDRLEFEIKTTGLPAGAYTVWWVVFNNFDECDGPCNPPDLFNPAVGGSVFYATGGIVEDEGGGLGSACFRDVHFVGRITGEPKVSRISSR